MLSVFDCTVKERYEPYFIFKSKAQITPFKGRFLRLLVLRQRCLRKAEFATQHCQVAMQLGERLGHFLACWLILIPTTPYTPPNCIGTLTASSSFLGPGAYKFGIAVPGAACVSFTQ